MKSIDDAQASCEAFYDLYCKTVASVARFVPKARRGVVLSTTFIKLHELLHMVGSIWQFGPVQDFSAGMLCVSSLGVAGMPH